VRIPVNLFYANRSVAMTIQIAANSHDVTLVAREKPKHRNV